MPVRDLEEWSQGDAAIDNYSGLRMESAETSFLRDTGSTVGGL